MMVLPEQPRDDLVRIRLVVPEGRSVWFRGSIYFESAMFDVSPNYAAHLVAIGTAEYVTE